MLRTRLLAAILLTLALLAGALGRAQAAWVCEGRVCSAGLVCCCVSAKEIQDPDCAGVAELSSDCAGKCGCVAVDAADSAGNWATVGKSFSVAVPAWDDVPAVLPLPPVVRAFVSLETPQVKALPPPTLRRCQPLARHASLRAPPALP